VVPRKRDQLIEHGRADRDGEGPNAGVEAGLAPGAAPLKVVDARPVGSTWLLDGLWHRLEVGAAVRQATDARRFTTNMERVLFALVANRAVAPMSKLSAAEWACEDVTIPGLSTVDDDQVYRAMDLLVDADTHARVQESVFFAVANLLNLEVDLLFFDTTSTYFERDEEEDGDDAFRRFGHSKDHRPDLPQIVIGLAVTKEGIPVRCWCWPGNSNDQQVLAEVKDDLRDWNLGRVITVVDRGFSSADNLAYLRRAGGHYIAGMRMRDGNPLVEQVLSRQGRYQHVKTAHSLTPPRPDWRSPHSSMRAMGVPCATSASSSTSKCTTPAAGAGTSSETLSTCTSARSCCASTSSPSRTNHVARTPRAAAMSRDGAGNKTSVMRLPQCGSPLRCGRAVAAPLAPVNGRTESAYPAQPRELRVPAASPGSRR
jgi:hypothetical protein